MLPDPKNNFRIALALLLPFVTCGVQWLFWSTFRPYVWFLFFPTVFSVLASQRILAEFTGMGGELLSGIWNDFQFNLSLNQSLLVTLEDQARWAIKNGLTDRRDLPNFFEAIYIDGLKTVKPEAVRVIR